MGDWAGLVGDLGDGHLPYWAAPGVRGEQALEGLGQSFSAQLSGIHVLHYSCSQQSACWSSLPIFNPPASWTGVQPAFPLGCL